MKRDGRRAGAIAAIDAAREEIIRISHDIHGYAELGFEELLSSSRLKEYLSGQGFRIAGVDGLPTAFVAEVGHGSPVIGFMAEYDALPEIGHACGHNIIAAAAVGAAVGVKAFIAESGGTVRVLGTPAEETMSAKILMVDKGVFSGLDAAMIVHPADKCMADDVSLAIRSFTVEFFGKAAHAASMPEYGVNALSAAVEFLVSVNAFREHMTKEGRIHAIITDGGTAVNVIPEHAEVKVAVRATTGEYLAELIEQVKRRARGAALSTGCRCEISGESLLCREIRVNPELSRLFEANFRCLGVEVEPRGDAMGSTDVGNVSHVVPTIQAYVGIGSGIAVHSTEFRDASLSPAGDEAVINGAKVMAMTAADIVGDESILARIRAGFEQD